MKVQGLKGESTELKVGRLLSVYLSDKGVYAAKTKVGVFTAKTLTEVVRIAKKNYRAEIARKKIEAYAKMHIKPAKSRRSRLPETWENKICQMAAMKEYIRDSRYM